MIEKNKESQTQSLGELQQELKSLKALLTSRGPAYPTTPSPSLPSFVGRPSIPAWQLAGSGSTEPATPIVNPAPSNPGPVPGPADSSHEGAPAGETA